MIINYPSATNHVTLTIYHYHRSNNPEAATKPAIPVNATPRVAPLPAGEVSDTPPELVRLPLDEASGAPVVLEAVLEADPDEDPVDDATVEVDELVEGSLIPQTASTSKVNGRFLSLQPPAERSKPSNLTR